MHIILGIWMRNKELSFLRLSEFSAPCRILDHLFYFDIWINIETLVRPVVIVTLKVPGLHIPPQLDSWNKQQALRNARTLTINQSKYYHKALFYCSDLGFCTSKINIFRFLWHVSFLT
jgi:hypothetical protein